MVTYSLLSSFSLLFLSRMIVQKIKTKLEEDHIDQLKSRIRTWFVILCLISVSTMMGKVGLILFFAMVSFLAFKELVSIVPIRMVDRRAIFWAYFAIPCQYFLIFKGFYVFSLIFVPVYLSLLLPIRLMLTGETKGFLRSTAILQWASMTMIFCLAHNVMFFIPLTRPFPLHARISTVIFLVFLTQLNDIFQYFFGKKFGRHLIVPKVSPNKTWEGFLGGVTMTAIVSYFWGPVMTPLDPIMSIIGGLIIGIAGFLGDVTMSSLKRDLGLKDTSLMLPGHGGIIDRVDSLLFSAPLFFHFFNCFWMKQ